MISKRERREKREKRGIEIEVGKSFKTRRDRSRRRYVSSDKVKKSAQLVGDASFFNLAGASEWRPEKAGKYKIDIVPYEVHMEKHPDRIEIGELWYRMPFYVHHRIGIDGRSIVCPRSIGKSCPICKARQKLEKDGSSQEELDATKTQVFVAYNILDPEDPSKICVFAMSYGKFAKFLAKELQTEDDDVLGFYHCDKAGRTLRVRFDLESFAGNKYLQANRFDFLPRNELDEDDILSKVVSIDTALNIMSYEDIKAMFDEGVAENGKKEEDEEEDREDGLDLDDVFESKGKKLKKRNQELKTSYARSEDDLEEEDEEEDEEELSRRKGKTEKVRERGKSSNKCPVEGGKFGVDCEKYDECDDCRHWEQCDEGGK